VARAARSVGALVLRREACPVIRLRQPCKGFRLDGEILGVLIEFCTLKSCGKVPEIGVRRCRNGLAPGLTVGAGLFRVVA
jgi:hypothetical protein